MDTTSKQEATAWTVPTAGRLWKTARMKRSRPPLSPASIRRARKSWRNWPPVSWLSAAHRCAAPSSAFRRKDFWSAIPTSASTWPWRTRKKPKTPCIFERLWRVWHPAWRPCGGTKQTWRPCGKRSRRWTAAPGRATPPASIWQRCSCTAPFSPPAKIPSWNAWPPIFWIRSAYSATAAW